MPDTAIEIDSDQIQAPSGWSLRRSFFKAICWAIDGLVAFGLAMITFEAVLNWAGVNALWRYAIASVFTAFVHQIVFTAFERVQIITTGRAIPIYRGNWWVNFIFADHLSNEVTGFVIVGGIQAAGAIRHIGIPPLSIWFLASLEPVSFFCWALAEDCANKYILKRESKVEFQQPAGTSCIQILQESFSWSVKHLCASKNRSFSVLIIMLKSASTYLTYLAGDELLWRLANGSSLEEAEPGTRALIAFIKTVIFFETFLFVAMRCPEALIENSQN